VKTSAGILVFRRRGTGIEVLLGHLGGPLWARKDEGAWSIPKGEYNQDETAIDAARREFTEELGLPMPAGDLVPLGEVTQAGGKLVTVWAIEGDLDPAAIQPGTFTMQWPPRSGILAEFPELDRVQWFDRATAMTKLVKAQQAFLARLPT
jgi:predicted NUDIX family NTP pyrophosphohydrolase